MRHHANRLITATPRTPPTAAAAGGMSRHRGVAGVLVEVVTVGTDDLAGSVEEEGDDVVVGGGKLEGVGTDAWVDVVVGMIDGTGGALTVVVVRLDVVTGMTVVELVAGVVVVVSNGSVGVVGAAVTVDAGRVVTGGEVVVGVVGSVLPTVEDVEVETLDGGAGAVVVVVQGWTG